MEKLPLHTPDLTNKNYSTLASLFPNAITEKIDENGTVVRTIDADVLAQEINTHVVSGKEERYQFTWPDKKRAVLKANSPIAAALRPCREESVNFDSTENIYIEGDNLDVLKLLRETYLNRVKMIYIDPPYNTGNDFIYEDDFAEEVGEFLSRDSQYDEDGKRMVPNPDSSGRFHTDWLNMVYPRLRIARDLLTDDGVIFISIDDNEVDNLRKICNEIFGSGNFVGVYLKQSKVGGGSDSKWIVKEHEYCIVYAKQINILPEMFIHHEHDYLKRYNESDNVGQYFWDTFARPGLKNPIIYDIFTPDGTKITNGWIRSKERFEKDLKDGTVRIIKKLNGEWSVQFKQYLNENGKKPRSMTMDFGGSIDGKTDIVELFNNDRIFSYPKSTKYIKPLIETLLSTDALILDFFSGSSTTAHAVMQLNAEDGGKRKFIMVQLPEVCAEDSEAAKAGYKNICEIGKERIRRAGKKIVNESPLDRAELDIGFRVLKLDSSNMKDVYYTPQETVSEKGALEVDLDGFIDNIKPDRTAEDLLFQVMLDLGISLSAKIEVKVFDGQTVYFVSLSSTDDHSHLLACFERITDEIVTKIAKHKPSYAVFRDSSFYNDATLVNFEQIFRTYSPTTIRKVL